MKELNRSSEAAGLAAMIRLDDERTLAELARMRPVLLVCLRHCGCLFTRQALTDLARHRSPIEATGAAIVLVQPGSPAPLAALADRYGLRDLRQITEAPPDLYARLGLPRGHVGALFGGAVWRAGWVAFFKEGHRVGRLAGDGRQLGGWVLLLPPEQVFVWAQEHSGDRPDYTQILARLPSVPVRLGQFRD